MKKATGESDLRRNRGILGGASGLWARSAPFIGIATLGTALGCGGLDGADPGTETTSGALQDPANPGNPNFPLASSDWAHVPGLPAPIKPTGDPTLLAADSHIVAVFVQAAPFGYYAGAGEGPTEITWSQYSGDVFATPPAVARLPTLNGNEEHMILVGRGGSDKRMFWSEGYIGPATAGVFPPPVPVTFPAFAAINSNTFSDPYGYPALASSSSGDVIMTYIGLNASNQPTVYAQVKPYNGHWKARVAAPALPTGWTLVVGKPTIAWGYLSASTIVVKAKTSTQTSFFRIFFDGTNFYDTLGPAGFRQLPLLTGSPSIGSDPALEWDGDLNAHTLYYRSGGNIYEASFTDNAFYEAFKKLTASSSNPTFVGSPSVYGGINLENTEHWIMGRDASFNMYFGFTDTDSRLTP